MLRSCYATQARLLRGSPRVSIITWYFVDGQPFLEQPLAVNSLNWVDDSERVDTGGIGEIPGARRPWRDGSGPIPGNGNRRPWGTEADFRLGGLLRLEPVVIGANGLPECCVQCAWGIATYPNHVQLHVEGFVSGIWNFAAFNDDWTLQGAAPLACSYATNVPLGPGSISMDLTVTSFLNLRFALSIGGVEVGAGYSLAVAQPLDPGTPITLPLTDPPDPADGTAPPFITFRILDLCNKAGGELLTDAGDIITTDAGDSILTS